MKGGDFSHRELNEHSMKTLSTLGIALALAAPAAHAQQLQVTLNGLQHDRGQVAVAVYSDAKSFRKDNQAFTARKAKAEAGTVTVTFDDVPSGRYAVLAYHDENDNGRLDLRFGMFPTEGYGLSNNPKVMGPPSYEDSAFEVTAEDPAQIELKMRY
jgi:uncharacterized protein (DUF2141 family)